MARVMKTAFAAMALASVAVPSAASAAVALTFSDTTGLSFNNAPFTFGFSFTTNGAINLTALGIFDSAQDGLAESHVIGIWNSVGTLLQSTTIASGTAAALTDKFRYGSVSSTQLAAGTYRIGALYLTGADALIGITPTSNFTTDPAISFGTKNFALGATLTDPTIVGPVTGIPAIDAGYFGPNFQFDAVAPVPEPETWISIVLGLALAGSIARRRRAKRAA